MAIGNDAKLAISFVEYINLKLEQMSIGSLALIAVWSVIGWLKANVCFCDVKWRRNRICTEVECRSRQPTVMNTHH